MALAVSPAPRALPTRTQVAAWTPRGNYKTSKLLFAVSLSVVSLVKSRDKQLPRVSFKVQKLTQQSKVKLYTSRNECKWLPAHKTLVRAKQQQLCTTTAGSSCKTKLN